jgi:mono/diheme cytochrome c family protein
MPERQLTDAELEKIAQGLMEDDGCPHFDEDDLAQAAQEHRDRVRAQHYEARV